MARKHKNIDKEEFEKLCGLQCTEFEICSFFDVTDKTLCAWCKRTYHENFSEVFKQKRGLGKISLRRIQWHHAETNPAMAMFLGKQFLDQSDNPKEKEQNGNGFVIVNLTRREEHGEDGSISE